MFNYIQVVLPALVLLLTVRGHVRAQGFFSTYSNPYQNSFAFSTPNLRQSFTTKLANAPQYAQIPTSFQFPDQQQPYNTNNFPQRQTFSFPDQQQYHFQSPQQQTAPQQFANADNQLRQQLAYLQLQQYEQQQLQQQYLHQQQQQRDAQMYEQFPASSRDTNSAAVLQNQQEAKTQNLLGVAYSPSTKVSQVKFDSGKLKYDF